MSRNGRWGLAVIVAWLSLSACAGTVESPAEAKGEPVKVEKIPGTDLSRLTLEARAAERIGVKTGKVGVLHHSGPDTGHTTVPYAAVLYDTKGATWVYTNPESLVFVRHPITVEYIAADVAVLRDGPPPGTSVVTDGAAELTGIEFGVGK
jgi:hypothetical protein